jgi:hypothetical protein
MAAGTAGKSSPSAASLASGVTAAAVWTAKASSRGAQQIFHAPTAHRRFCGGQR